MFKRVCDPLVDQMVLSVKVIEDIDENNKVLKYTAKSVVAASAGFKDSTTSDAVTLSTRRYFKKKL
jgi:hypothetical protein